MRTSAGRLTQPVFDDIFAEIYRRWPEAETFDPCPCGLTLAIVRPEDVQAWHYTVPDTDLRERVSQRITELGLLYANYRGVDAVLIIAEVA